MGVDSLSPSFCMWCISFSFSVSILRVGGLNYSFALRSAYYIIEGTFSRIGDNLSSGILISNSTCCAPSFLSFTSYALLSLMLTLISLFFDRSSNFIRPFFWINFSTMSLWSLICRCKWLSLSSCFLNWSVPVSIAKASFSWE